MWRIKQFQRGVEIRCHYVINADDAEAYIADLLPCMASNERITIDYIARKVRVVQGAE